jgi:hypothetical protein
LSQAAKTSVASAAATALVARAPRIARLDVVAEHLDARRTSRSTKASPTSPMPMTPTGCVALLIRPLT